MTRTLLSLALCLVVSTAQAQVKPAPIFGDHMVLQRGMPVPIFGKAEPGEEVSVHFADQKKTTRTSPEGTWTVKLDALEAGGPHKLEIVGKNTVQFKDVLVGEVWLCSGQSNMGWRLKQSANAKEESAKANLPNLRFSTGAGWQACTPESALAFSACGYYFGRDLHKSLNVPVGLIHRSVGGTSARRWTDADVIASEPALAPFRAAITRGTAGKKGNAKPGDLYRQHIRPVVGHAIRGAIWYQGESDAGVAEEYAVLFPTMIRAWRKAWGQGDFPFLYVQLAPHAPGARTWPRLREVQAQTLALVPNTAMAVIIDSDPGIHPLKKELPGSRLALAARALAYGEKIEYSGPVFDKMIREGDRAVLHFQHTGTGLTVKGETLTGFTVIDEAGKSHPAQAMLADNTVVVTCKEVPAFKAVRYGWDGVPPCNLFNKDGLPASPFRTDVPAKKEEKR